MIIYKYIDQWGLSVLRDQRIKITKPERFNDPFEFLPRITARVPRAQTEAQFRSESFRRNWFKHKPSGSPDTFSKFCVWLDSQSNQLIDAIHAENHNPNYTPFTFATGTASKFGVTCFSESSEIILMWSHYADSHKGMVIGFDFGYLKDLVYPVIYSMARQEYHPSMTTTRDECMMKTLRTKSVDWAYEREHRLIPPWESCIEDKGMHFMTFYPVDIREVILGCKASEPFKTDVSRVLKSAYPHVELAEMRIDDSRFILNRFPPVISESPDNIDQLLGVAWLLGMFAACLCTFGVSLFIMPIPSLWPLRVSIIMSGMSLMGLVGIGTGALLGFRAASEYQCGRKIYAIQYSIGCSAAIIFGSLIFSFAVKYIGR